MTRSASNRNGIANAFYFRSRPFRPARRIHVKKKRSHSAFISDWIFRHDVVWSNGWPTALVVRRLAVAREGDCVARRVRIARRAHSPHAIANTMEALAQAWNAWDNAVSTTTFSVLKVRAAARPRAGLSEILDGVLGRWPILRTTRTRRASRLTPRSPSIANPSFVPRVPPHSMRRPSTGKSIRSAP